MAMERAWSRWLRSASDPEPAAHADGPHHQPPTQPPPAAVVASRRSGVTALAWAAPRRGGPGPDAAAPLALLASGARDGSIRLWAVRSPAGAEGKAPRVALVDTLRPGRAARASPPAAAIEALALLATDVGWRLLAVDANGTAMAATVDAALRIRFQRRWALGVVASASAASDGSAVGVVTAGGGALAVLADTQCAGWSAPVNAGLDGRRAAVAAPLPAAALQAPGRGRGGPALVVGSEGADGVLVLSRPPDPGGGGDVDGVDMLSGRSRGGPPQGARGDVDWAGTPLRGWSAGRFVAGVGVGGRGCG